MIIKSFQIPNKKSDLLKYNLFLLYGENVGLKKDIRKLITEEITKKDGKVEVSFLYENEIISNEENFYNSIFSGSLFGDKKIITVYDATDKIMEKISYICERKLENVTLIFFSEVLEKRSKLRTFFETNKKIICTPCYLDNEKDLATIAQLELKKNNIILSQEIINLLVENSNSDRNNLRNEINKIISFSLNKKKLELQDIKNLINFSGDYKSDIFVNECLCGNIKQYKKIISELYASTVNQVLLLRILSNKIQRLLKMKEEEARTNNLDAVISASKPPIFWKEKPLVKKQLSIWNLSDLKKMINEINNTELLCKKNPNISNVVFFSFFSKICKRANSSS